MMTPTLGKRMLWTLRLAIVLAVPGALATGPARALGQPAVVGQWEPKFDLHNVAIHVHVLPTGKVLFWSRREWDLITGKPAEGLDPHPPHCTPRIWDPATGTVSETPKLDSINLFCSGHTFLPDGRLFVVGGHIHDGQGDDRATISCCFLRNRTSRWSWVWDLKSKRRNERIDLSIGLLSA